MRRIVLLFLAAANACYGYAQGYQAIHGSQYPSSLNTAANPASIVNAPYTWDVAVFGAQYQTISNTVSGRNFPSFLLEPDAPYYANSGNFKRAAAANINMRLLNARISLNERHAIAFGANMRGYTQANTGSLNYNDSVRGPITFIYYNQSARNLSLQATSSAWMELFATYGITLADRSNDRLNVALTLKVLRGISGAHASLSNLDVNASAQDGEETYTLAGGEAIYGYSHTHDDPRYNSGFTANPRQLLKKSRSGLAFDLGLEYIIKEDGFTNVFDDDRPDGYLWKIGVSILDIGWNNFLYSNESRRFSEVREGITGNELLTKFAAVRNPHSFNDSLATIVRHSDALSGQFRILTPARLKINVDRHLSGNFYINGELSVNLPSLLAKDKLFVQESQVLAITPRWETKRLGIYMPLQYNRQGNVWVGGAVRIGPLLMGSHHLLNAFSRKNNISGGAYLALIIHPSQLRVSGRNKQYECPVF